MTPWLWFWLEAGDHEHGGWQGECDTREEAIAQAQRDLPAGTAFSIIEARSSTALKYEGNDCVPFLRTRNEERLINGPRPCGPGSLPQLELAAAGDARLQVPLGDEQ